MNSQSENVVATIKVAERSEGELALSKSVSVIELEAEAIVVASEEDFASAGEFGRMLKRKSAEVTEFFAPLKKAAHDAHKQVCDREKQMLSPLLNAEKIVKKTMGAWQEEQERKCREAEEALRRQAREESDRRLAEAIELEKKGKKDESEAALAEAQVMLDASNSIYLGYAKAKAEGVSTGKDWVIESVNSNAVPTVFCGVVIRSVDESAVLKLIRASKGTIQIPGIRYKEIAKLSFRK